MDERVLAALIGAVVVALGWLISDRRDRLAERRRRRDKEADLMRALGAEIAAHVHQLEMNRLEEHQAEMLARMTREPDFIVMVPGDTHATIFRALLPEIHLLPGDVVEPVSLYYSQIITVAHLAEDIRSDRYAQISPERRAALYGHFIDMKMEALRMGQLAASKLERAIGRAQ
ncbi:MAG: hypothetical protein AAGE80_09725 [Pseudomonadota bacterium]